MLHSPLLMERVLIERSRLERILIERSRLPGRAFTRNELTAVELVLVHLVEWRRIGVDADGGREGGVADVVRVIGTEGAGLAGVYDAALVASTMLLKNSGRYEEGSGGLTVIVKAGGLSGQPADYPDVVIGAVIQPLIPAVTGAQLYAIQPSIGRCEERDDAGEFFGRSRDGVGLAFRCCRFRCYRFRCYRFRR